MAISRFHMSGSSPYTWGALQAKHLLAQDAGITPIYMGSTLSVFSALLEHKDHPHIHGEHQ